MFLSGSRRPLIGDDGKQSPVFDVLKVQFVQWLATTKEEVMVLLCGCEEGLKGSFR